MIVARSGRKPHLFAVHLDTKTSEFRQAAALWKRKESFGSRTLVTHPDIPNPFQDDSEEPLTDFTQVTVPDYGSDDPLARVQSCFRVGENTFEIASQNGEIAQCSFPSTVRGQDIVVMGGLLVEGGCLPNAFKSLLARTNTYSGERRAVFRVPLDCVYTSEGTAKDVYVRQENDFSRKLAGHCGDRYAITLDGELLAGREDAFASLHWFSTTGKMLDIL